MDKLRALTGALPRLGRLRTTGGGCFCPTAPSTSTRRAASIDTPLHFFAAVRSTSTTCTRTRSSRIAASAHPRDAHAGNLRRAPWATCHGFARATSWASPCRRMRDQNPNLRSASLMGEHGFISAGATPSKACYENTLDLHRTRAASTVGWKRGAPPGAALRRAGYQTLRRRGASARSTWLAAHRCAALVGQGSAQAFHLHRSRTSPKVPALRELQGPGARLAELGTCCPDHFLRTKIKPALRRLESAGRGRRRAAKAKLAAGLEPYRADYARLLRAVQARQLPGDARPEPDRRA